MQAEVYLADTNILLRLVKRDHPEYSSLRLAADALKKQGIGLAYTLQNMAEFWNASTRPIERNGFGLTIDETENNAQEIERSFLFVADNEAVYREWRRLVFQHQVSGVQVHDARLAASMLAHKIQNILTFNTSDFSRFSGITAIHPNEVKP